METYHRIRIEREKRIACIAHDNKKAELVDWMRFNRGSLERHCLYATRTTGRIIAEEWGLPVTTSHSGPLGGDLEIGARIARGAIEFLIVFWDPLEPLPHDPDVRALLRVAAGWNVPVACTRASADVMVSSPLMREPYDRLVPPCGADRTRPPTAPSAPVAVAAARDVNRGGTAIQETRQTRSGVYPIGASIDTAPAPRRFASIKARSAASSRSSGSLPSSGYCAIPAHSDSPIASP